MNNIIDLFAGCGGLTEGFKKTGKYNLLASVEWDKDANNNLRNRLETKWQIKNANDIAIQFDIQQISELINGGKDSFGNETIGINNIIEKKKVDIIIGGPPCQAYSLVGRISDKNMKNDYRNFLFESYIKLVDYYKPEVFVFENVPGMLSAKVGEDNVPVVNLIKEGFESIGYEIFDDLKQCIVNAAEYGVPQTRKRIIIVGIKKNDCLDVQTKLNELYKTILPKYKSDKVDVSTAIGDLPALTPLSESYKTGNRNHSHTLNDNANIFNHIARYQNKRDIEIFRILTKDIEKGKNAYKKIDEIKKLYTQKTGKSSNIHKYNVLKMGEQSNTITAHLQKDGLRYIHPDSKQCRTITVREAARLQTFDDDYEFIGSLGAQYRMIGNAVPPLLSECIAKAINEMFFL